jgi:signal transduction histidine kinase
MISLAGAAVVLALTIALSLLVVRSSLRPLATITGGVERLALGDYNYRLAAPGGIDEVGRLASAFDHMAGAISVAFATQRRFVADASHELRTPLTALRGYTDVLLLGIRDDPTTADRVLHSMQDDLTRMSRLVNDLLTLARLDGESSLQLQPVALQALLFAARDEAEIIAGESHTVTIDTTDEPMTVLADRDRLRQVLSNVLGNAGSYATPGTPIRISAARHGGTVVVSIIDQGPGIPAKDLERLGERFYRGDAARSRRTGGTGLGIAIARGIMRAHGGSLEIDSFEGRGTTVTIKLPLANVPH